MRHFRTCRIGFVGQRKELLAVRAGLLAVAGGFGGARGALEGSAKKIVGGVDRKK